MSKDIAQPKWSIWVVVSRSRSLRTIVKTTLTYPAPTTYRQISQCTQLSSEPSIAIDCEAPCTRRSCQTNLICSEFKPLQLSKIKLELRKSGNCKLNELRPFPLSLSLLAHSASMWSTKYRKENESASILSYPLQPRSANGKLARVIGVKHRQSGTLSTVGL